LISELKRRGHRVGVIKHDAHEFEIDHAGKDSWRLTHAGADTMIVSSAAKMAIVKLNQPRKNRLCIICRPHISKCGYCFNRRF
jgi:molybdopterin-guanine dinucleotide biosynthesis protein MobB